MNGENLNKLTTGQIIFRI